MNDYGDEVVLSQQQFDILYEAFIILERLGYNKLAHELASEVL